MAGPQFPSTNLPVSNDVKDIAQGHLDLLQKINRVSASIPSNSVLTPLSAAPSANVSYSLPKEAGTYTIYIPSAYLVASANGPFTLTMSSPGNTTSSIQVPILAAGTHTPQDMLFVVYVSSTGVVAQQYAQNLFATSAYNPAFFRYQTTDNVATQYIHMKTNIPVNASYADMFGVHFLGYNYGEAKTIDAMLGFYSYSGGPSIINICTSGTHTCSAYESADNFVVMTISVASTYYIGFICDQISASPQGLVTSIVVTASTHTGSATGAY